MKNMLVMESVFCGMSHWSLEDGFGGGENGRREGIG